MWWRIRRSRGELLGRLKKCDYGTIRIIICFSLGTPLLLNKVVHDDDKNKDKRDDIERWNDHLNYRG